MFFGQTSQEIRQVFLTSFGNYLNKKPLTPLEKQIVTVILDHPEYHALLKSGQTALERDYFPEYGETNPFLHMGLHLAIREQISTNRPDGVRPLFDALKPRYAEHDLEHLFMERLAECLWAAQKNKLAPDETLYLQTLTQLKNDNK